jgi:hypothetical protein
MAYHIDADSIRLDDLQKRIEATDLVPSRACLTDEIGKKIKAFEKQGIETLASLRIKLKTPKRLASVAEATGIDTQYLILLRREIESYFPKPATLKVFDWLPEDEIAKLEQHEIGNTATLYEMAGSSKKRSALVKSTGVDNATLEMLARLADLMRVQWVSPAFARMLIEAGYDSADKVASADTDDLCEALSNINAEKRFFKGKIGLRDTRRLILAASYTGPEGRCGLQGEGFCASP